MKKHINYISAIFLATIMLGSCDSDDGYRDDPSYIGGYANVAPASRTISVFDTNSDLTINLFSDEGVTFESIDVMSGGNTIGSATIVDEETATMNASIFDDIEEGASFPIRLRSTLSNGNTSNDPFTISVDPVFTLDGDNPSTVVLDSIDFQTISYETYTNAATIDDITFEIKKNADSDYNDTDLDLDTQEGTIALSDVDYESLDLAVNDTIYYRLTASSGSLSDSVEDYMVVIPKPFSVEATAMLSNDEMMNQLDLVSGENVEEDGDIMYMEPNGFAAVEGSDIEFVIVSQDDFYDDADVNDVQEAFDDGIKVSAATNVSQGAVFVYSTTRDGNTVYGKMRIGDITVTNANATSISIEYAEGR